MPHEIRHPRMKAVVIGGGIAGLAVASGLQRGRFAHFDVGAEHVTERRKRVPPLSVAMKRGFDDGADAAEGVAVRIGPACRADQRGRAMPITSAAARRLLRAGRRRAGPPRRPTGRPHVRPGPGAAGGRRRRPGAFGAQRHATRSDPPPARPTATASRPHAQGGALVAHNYARYLGDLSGGQAVGKILDRTFDLSGARLAFYEFPMRPKPYKDSYRAKLDALSLDAEEIDGTVDR